MERDPSVYRMKTVVGENAAVYWNDDGHAWLVRAETPYLHEPFDDGHLGILFFRAPEAHMFQAYDVDEIIGRLMFMHRVGIARDMDILARFEDEADIPIELRQATVLRDKMLHLIVTGHESKSPPWLNLAARTTYWRWIMGTCNNIDLDIQKLLGERSAVTPGWQRPMLATDVTVLDEIRLQ